MNISFSRSFSDKAAAIKWNTPSSREISSPPPIGAASASPAASRRELSASTATRRANPRLNASIIATAAATEATAPATIATYCRSQVR